MKAPSELLIVKCLEVFAGLSTREHNTGLTRNMFFKHFPSFAKGSRGQCHCAVIVLAGSLKPAITFSLIPKYGAPQIQPYPCMCEDTFQAFNLVRDSSVIMI